MTDVEKQAIEYQLAAQNEARLGVAPPSLADVIEWLKGRAW